MSLCEKAGYHCGLSERKRMVVFLVCQKRKIWTFHQISKAACPN
jgi:hypothetical protein